MLTHGTAAADSKMVKLEANRKEKTVTVKIGDEVFTVFNLSDELPKPFASPVYGPGGTVMSRAISQPGNDHPHHKGIWVAVDEVNKIKFWAERGKIKNIGHEATALGKGAAFRRGVAGLAEMIVAGGRESHLMALPKIHAAKPLECSVFGHDLH